MSSELLATYSGLGVRDGEEYYKGDECLACVKDLIRSLRNDDSSCEIRRQLGKACILQRDLLPILVTSTNDTVLRNDVIRLLVNLTQPAYLCFGSEYPKKKDVETMKCFIEVNHYLRQYKEAFTAENVVHVLGSVLAELCQKEWEDRDDDDIIVIERILLLLRNVLHITPDPQEEKRTEDDVSIHDQVIWNLHVNGMDELLLFLGSNPDESQWCMHVVEIVFLMMREQSASALARTGKGRSAEEKKRDEDIVDEALTREKARKLKARQIRGTRHSRFGGTFVVANQKSIAGTERVYHRSLAGLSDYSYDVEKRPRRTPKPRQATADVLSDRMSTYSIRVILKNMCVQFLECCFNPLMRVVRENIMHNRAMDNDESYYLWALRFFLEFSRTHDFRVDIVGEALQLPTLHYIIRLMASYYDSMVVEKKRVQDARQWGQRLHYALQAYKELLLYINEMITSKDENLRENAKVMQNNIFYHPEYRDIFVTLFRNFREVLQTRTYLRNLVETTHVYVRMLERFGRENRHVVVQGRRKKSSKKSKRSKGGPKHPGGVLTEHQLVDLWEKMDARVEELLEGRERLPDTAVPFDATSDTPIEEQKIVAMGRIRLQLIEACHAEAVSLMRAAREVWPDDAFGRSGMSIDEELDTIKAILFNPAAALPAARLLADADDDEDGEGEEEEGGGGGGGGGEVVTYETEFDLNKYIQRFSNNKIVRAYSMVLADYRTNSDTINHAVVKMLHRVSVDLKMAPLLYQLSVFKTMQNILHEPTTGRYKELQRFARYIVSGFFHMADKNPLLFAELLFWKTSRDCYELTEGYGALEREKELRQLSSMWTREQEEELAELYERFKEEEDIVACIEAALPKDIPRSRRQIAAQLVKQGLVGSTKEVYKHKKKGVWSEEELCQLREVFNPGEDHKAAVQEVAEYFPGRGLRDITQQLKTLGLLPERNKKRRRSSSNVNSGSEDEGTNKVAPPPKRGRKKTGVDGDSRGGRRRGRKEGVRGLVSHLHGNGYSHQLAWLEAYLDDEARDRRLDDEWEEMCIVPVSETVSKALELDEFQRLLSSLELQPPTQQEIYWRIPPTMTPAQLNSAADSLKVPVQGVESEGGSGEEEEEEEEEDEREEEKEEEEEKTLAEADDSDEQFNLLDEGEMSVSDALAALRKKRKKPSECFDEVERKASPAWAGGPKVPKKPRLATHSSFLQSESEDDERTHQNGVVKRQEEDVSSHRSATVGTCGRKRVRHVMDSDSEDEQDDGDRDDDLVRVEGDRESLSSPDKVNHLLNPNPLESLPTSSQIADTVDHEVHQSDSASECDWEKKQHHGNEGSMPKLALSETQSETVDPSQLQAQTLNLEEQNIVHSPESHHGAVASIETSAPQPHTYTDGVDSSGHIEVDEGDDSNRSEDDECGHRSKRRRMLLDLESSDEEL